LKFSLQTLFALLYGFFIGSETEAPFVGFVKKRTRSKAKKYRNCFGKVNFASHHYSPSAYSAKIVSMYETKLKESKHLFGLLCLTFEKTSESKPALPSNNFSFIKEYNGGARSMQRRQYLLHVHDPSERGIAKQNTQKFLHLISIKCVLH
jgi:hypothetical protein